MHFSAQGGGFCVCCVLLISLEIPPTRVCNKTDYEPFVVSGCGRAGFLIGFYAAVGNKGYDNSAVLSNCCCFFLSKLCNFSYLIFSTDLYSCRLNQSSSIFPTICYELSFGCKAACHIGNMELVHAKANKHEFRDTKETHSLIFCSNKPSTISKLFSVFAVIPSGPSVPPSPTCLGLGPCTPLHASTFTQSY